MKGMKLPSIKTLLSIIFTLFFSLWLLFTYGERWLHSLLLYLSKATWARQIVSQWKIAWLVASRFIAGTDIESAIQTTRALNAKGMRVTLDYLGESVTTASEAAAARDQILNLLDRIHDTGVNANISVKLSQLGLKIDERLAYENACALLQRARQYNNRVRIDMEDSSTIDTTLQIYRHLRDEAQLPNVGIVIQAYLYRSVADVEKLIAEGAWIRLCKGAYAEPSDVAFPVKLETDSNYIKLMQMLLSNKARQHGVFAGIATHDPRMIQATIDYAKTHQIPAADFEFQMLHGVRRELQENLVAEGYGMRIYVPYGAAWYPYFMRRLAERPANLWFFVRNFFRN